MYGRPSSRGPPARLSGPCTNHTKEVSSHLIDRQPAEAYRLVCVVVYLLRRGVCYVFPLCARRTGVRTGACALHRLTVRPAPCFVPPTANLPVSLPSLPVLIGGGACGMGGVANKASAKGKAPLPTPSPPLAPSPFRKKKRAHLGISRGVSSLAILYSVLYTDTVAWGVYIPATTGELDQG